MPLAILIISVAKYVCGQTIYLYVIFGHLLQFWSLYDVNFLRTPLENSNCEILLFPNQIWYYGLGFFLLSFSDHLEPNCRYLGPLLPEKIVFFFCLFSFNNIVVWPPPAVLPWLLFRSHHLALPSLPPTSHAKTPAVKLSASLSGCMLGRSTWPYIPPWKIENTSRPFWFRLQALETCQSQAMIGWNLTNSST